MDLRGICYIAVGYLSGSVLFAVLAGELFGKRELLQLSADKNPGTVNAFRYCGFWCGVLTLAGDLAKGFLPVYLYLRAAAPAQRWALPLVMAAPVVGHILPIFHHFRGGKGIAATFGVLLGLCPYDTPLALFAAVFMVYILLAQKAPNAFGAAYKLGDVYRKLPFPSPVYQLNRQMEPILERYIEEHHFDAVVTTHLFPAEILTSMKRRETNVPRTYFIATDYACIPFTEETDLDRYIIPAKELTAEFVGRGIDRERIRPLGIPVRRQFYGQEDRSAIRGRLGLDLGKK